jgi:iron transport multicopper oxidase
MASTTNRSPSTRFRFSVNTSFSRDPFTNSHCITAGQRYSFVLTANKLVSNYWIRAQPTLLKSNQGFINATNSAILRYVGAPKRDPTTNSAIKQPLVETALHPLIPSKVPGKHFPGRADYNLRFEITFNGTTSKWQLNGTVCNHRWSRDENY